MTNEVQQLFACRTNLPSVELIEQFYFY